MNSDVETGVIVPGSRIASSPREEGQSAVNSGSNPSHSSVTPDKENYICMAIGRENDLNLRHCDHLPDNDEDLFKRLLAVTYQELRSRFLKQLIFPLKIKSVQYWEVCVCWNPVTSRADVKQVPPYGAPPRGSARGGIGHTPS